MRREGKAQNGEGHELEREMPVEQEACAVQISGEPAEHQPHAAKDLDFFKKKERLERWILCEILQSEETGSH